MSIALQRFVLLFQLAGVYMVVFLLFRIGFWVVFGTPADVPASHLPLLLGVALVNDAVESLYLLMPLAL